MADNIMGGGYGPDDITANVGVNLNNIDSSIADATSLADQIKQWSVDNEAFIKGLSDTQEAMVQLTSELQKQLDLKNALVSAEGQLRDIAVVGKQSVQDTANYYKEINGVLSNMSNNIGVVSMLGGQGAAAAGGSPMAGAGGLAGAGLLYGNPGLGDNFTGGQSAISSVGNGGGAQDLADQMLMNQIINPNDPSGSQTGGTSPSSTGNGGGSDTAGGDYGQNIAKKMLGLNYWMPGGRAAAMARYADRLSGGGISKGLGSVINKFPKIFGGPNQGLTAAGEEAFTGSMMEQGIGPMTSAQAALLPEGVAASIMPEIGMAAGEAAAIGGLGLAASAGMLGTVGSMMMAAAPVAAAGYIGMKAYNTYATVSRQGQLMGSLTGNSSASPMLQMESQDYLASLFNPRMSYGQMKDITMTGLAAGYNNGGDTGGFFGTPGGMLGQYTNFASQQYQQYGMSAQDSQAFFDAGVVQAGSSAAALGSALDQLAKTSAQTNTSFAVLKENFLQYTQTFAGLGMGSASIGLATGAATVNANNPLLSGAGSTASLLNTSSGQALAAQAAGIPFTQIYNYSQTKQGATALVRASNMAVLNILKGLGLYPGMPNMKDAVGAQAYVLTQILGPSMLNIPVPKDSNGGQSWDEKHAVAWVLEALSNNGQGESVDTGNIKSAETAISNLAGGKNPYGAEGIKSTLSNLNKDEISHQGTEYIDGHHAITEYRFKLNGKTVTMTGSEIESQSASVRDKIMEQIYNGTATVGLVTNDGKTLGFNANNTSGKLTGSTALQAIQAMTPSQQKALIMLDPAAKGLFMLLQNPEAYNNLSTQQKAAMGFGPGNTTQTKNSGGRTIYPHAG